MRWRRQAKDLLTKKTSDAHACDEISIISPKNVTSHFKYYSSNIKKHDQSFPKKEKKKLLLIPGIDHCINATC